MDKPKIEWGVDKIGGRPIVTYGYSQGNQLLLFSSAKGGISISWPAGSNGWSFRPGEAEEFARLILEAAEKWKGEQGDV